MRLIEISNQLETRSTVYAMDALRNLFVQAHLVERPHYADAMLDLGLITLCENIIEKAVN